MEKGLQYCIPIVLLLFILGCGSTGTPLTDDYHRVKEGKLYGFIDNRGQKVIGCQFAYANDFSEGLAGVNVGGTADGYDMPSNGKWGFINRNGKIVINPKYYPAPTQAAPYSISALSRIMHEGYIFSEGLAAVRTDKEWVYINQQDSIVIRGLEIQSARSFSEGLAAVMIGDKWGYIDTYGNVVIKPAYLFPVNFSSGFALVMDDKLKMNCIDKQGNVIYSQYRINSNFHNGIASVNPQWKGEMISIEENLKVGLVNAEGHELVVPQFDDAGIFSEGLCPVLVGAEKIGIMAFSNDLKTKEFEGGKWGYVDSTGRFMINPIYDDAKEFHEGFAAVKRNGKWGYINKRGRYVYAPQFLQANHFDGGAAWVKLSNQHHPYEGKFAYISTAEKIIWTAR